MVKLLHILITYYLKLFKLSYFLFIFSCLIQLKTISCDNCKIGNIITNEECFNNILIFNSKTYRAGQFAKNKYGDIVIEYSSEASRLFYGLKQNGEYFFSGESHTKVIEDIGTDNSYYKRYESINIFVSLEDDINKDNQYLFTTGSYKSLTELFDFRNNNYKIRNTQDFIGNQIFSYQFVLLESKINDKNIYFCLYTHGDGEDGNKYTIKKFGLTSFDLNSYNNINSKTLENNRNNRIITAFIIEEDDIIAVIFDRGKLAISFYDFELKIMEKIQNLGQ